MEIYMLNLLALAATTMMVGPQPHNLIFNGDFSHGNKGFTSDYYFHTDSVLFEGSYGIAKSPHELHSNGADFGTHLNRPGNLLVVNGASESGKAIWEQKVKVLPRHTYTFGLWGASWSHNGDEPRDVSPARIVVYINGKAINSPFKLVEQDGVWDKLVTTWVSEGATDADIRVVDDNVDGYGNDFALCNFVFHL